MKCWPAPTPFVADARHPADLSPTNNVMTINEVTAYSLAWKTGQPWPIAPTNIPVEFVARAGYLWKNGEQYTLDTNYISAGPPLWWTNLSSATVSAEAATGLASVRPIDRDARTRRAVAKSALSKPLAASSATGHSVEQQARGTAMRWLKKTDSASGPITVNLRFAPGNDVSAYVAEENLPSGWTASEISGGGVFDAGTGRLRWGLFFDHDERTVSYVLHPPTDRSIYDRLSGIVSFDGWNVETGGADALTSSDHPQLLPPILDATGDVTLKLHGEPGGRYLIELSNDLVHWQTLSAVTADENGQVEFVKTAKHADRQRFYRVRVLQD